MRQYAAACGVEDPSLLTATHLRKHMATKCLTLGLKELEVENLANHVGHSKEIHKSHYSQPVPSLHIVNLSGLLEAASNIRQASCKLLNFNIIALICIVN